MASLCYRCASAVVAGFAAGDIARNPEPRTLNVIQRVMPTDPLATAAGKPGDSPTAARKTRVVLLYKRHTQPDEQVLHLLEAQLGQAGFSVFIDRHLTLGVEWAKEIERQIRTADAVVPLLSAQAATSEMMGFEIEIAHESAQSQRGRPRLLPVRLNYRDALPEPLASILDPIQYLLWEKPEDSDRLVDELVRALQALPPPSPAEPVLPAKGARLVPKPYPLPPGGAPAAAAVPIEPIGGAVPLDSAFYIVRPADVELRAALSRHDSVILLKGARQIGKTSLLARGLKFARENKAAVALTDFQKFNATNLETVGNLHLSLAESLADQLDLPVQPSDIWDERRGPNVNFERYLRREVLGRIEGQVVWGLDEVDRLFAYPYASEVFGLFRSWHNERALDPTGPWARLTLAIAYATEAHLFITDINQSPFNIGTRLALEDFWPDQVAELNERYGRPLRDKGEVEQFIRLVGGHPYLVRRGLHEMAKRKITLHALEEKAPRDDGLYGDHLRRILLLLARDVALTEIVRGILRGQPCPSADSFYRLRSAGLMKGTSASEVQPRCQLYAAYLSRHLLEAGWAPQL
jgi:hypothetical protein